MNSSIWAAYKSTPDIDGIIRAIEAQDVVRIAQSMGNVLENVTVPLYPVIETIKQDMLSHGSN